mmetsp:Transcript_2520/g.7559  ORF Transcript_2520/g.7559 Transcript_2520/m.7559 type:complete len:607 (+) Transcript_2520:74-1894(+)
MAFAGGAFRMQNVGGMLFFLALRFLAGDCTLEKARSCGLGDASSSVQAGVRVREDTHLEVSSGVYHTSDGPTVLTGSGAIRGVQENGCYIFKKIPYVEAPERFAKSIPKKPWVPKVLDGTKYGPGCIGSHTDVPEREDCLNLNIWVPRGNYTNMPVMVYFHGGMLQHGSGQEALRQGDGITQSSKYPTIFVNFDFRLGIFGWFEGYKELNISRNLGLHDQQNALRWIKQNIAAFGGDPTRVTLQGQSEGAGIILAHLVSPGSAGLFHRAIFHSPPADMWSRKANKERTWFMIKRANCYRKRPEIMLRCLTRKSAQELWAADWVSEELSRHVLSPRWTSNLLGLLGFAAAEKTTSDLPFYLGWHAVVDGESLPGEPRELIAQGKWAKVPVLMTVSKNESYGIFPGAASSSAAAGIELGLNALTKSGDLPRIKTLYNQSLLRSGIHVSDMQLLHEMVTDKMWTCDVRALASDIVRGGGEAHVGMFWHSPKWDPVGRMTNPECQHGATCHAAEMLYALPQGHGTGVAEQRGMDPEEVKFASKYRDEVLAFVHGDKIPWVKYDTVTEPMTFYDKSGARLVRGYRKQQCDVLDSSFSEGLPMFMRKNTKQL